MRIGHGYDVHKLITGTGIVLGGVKISCDYALEAHSDGDVVIHALCDALLGAAALGDIGQHFPDDKDENKKRDSQIFLRSIFSLLTQHGYRINNVDVSIIAQVPKLRPHLSDMQTNIAACLQTLAKNINLKATTTEGLGFIGRKEGIAVHAVTLLVENNNSQENT